MTLPQAVLLDRDGTLIEDRHYLSDPEGVVLLPGVGEGLARLAAAVPGLALAVVAGVRVVALTRFAPQ